MKLTHQYLTKIGSLIEELKDKNKQDIAKNNLTTRKNNSIVGDILCGNYGLWPNIIEQKPYFATISYSDDTPLLGRYYFKDKKDSELAHEVAMRHEIDEAIALKRILDKAKYTIPEKKDRGIIGNLVHRLKQGRKVYNIVAPEATYSHLSPEVLAKESILVSSPEVSKGVRDYFRFLRTFTGERKYMRDLGHEMYSGNTPNIDKLIQKRLAKKNFGRTNLLYNFPVTLPEAAVELIRSKMRGV